MIKSKMCNKLTVALFTIYLLILTWIILFKMQFSLTAFGQYRNINLIPYAGSLIVNGRIDLSEIFQNIFVFVPTGIYMCMLDNSRSFLQKALPVAVFSLTLEVLQYVFAIGATDITDLIGNTLGGIIGIAIYQLIQKLLKSENKTNKVLQILALIGTIGLTALIIILITANL